MSHVTLAQSVLRTSSICHPHVVVVLILFDPLLCTLHRLSSSFHSPGLHLHLPCGLVRREVHAHLANEELGTLAENNPLTPPQKEEAKQHHPTEERRNTAPPQTGFATCYNLGDVLEKLRDTRTEHVSVSRHQNRR